MAKKLLILLGAGSSIPCGMPSVCGLDSLTRTWGRAWASSRGYPNFFEMVWQAIEVYYRKSKQHLSPQVNFETALGELVALAHWMTPAPWGNTLKQVAGGQATLASLVFPFPADYGPAVTVRDQLCHILIELATHVRATSRTFDPATEHARDYVKLFEGLRGTFEIGVYNLNYDTVSLRALPGAFTGFSSAGNFEPVAIHKRQSWDFLYHLHGSVHHSLIGSFGNRIEWRGDLSGPFDDGHQGRSPDDRSGGKSCPKTTLIAGGFKLDQLLVEPFHSFHAALIKHVYEADAILIGGYGFADVHVNQALRNRLEHSAAADRPPIMILDRASNTTSPMAFREDIWSHEVCRTLHTNKHSFREAGQLGAPVPEELAAENAFEVNACHHIALWYGGFTGAAARLDGILSWLGGADDTVLNP